MWDQIIINPFINVLLFIYSLIGNFGVAIILFTILIRLLTHPLTVQQLKGTTAMQDLQKDKRWIEAQAKYKNDKEKLAQVQMELYKELGVNPVCLLSANPDPVPDPDWTVPGFDLGQRQFAGRDDHFEPAHLSFFS